MLQIDIPCIVYQILSQHLIRHHVETQTQFKSSFVLIGQSLTIIQWCANHPAPMLQHLHVSACTCKARIVRIQVGRELDLYHVPSLLERVSRASIAHSRHCRRCMIDRALLT
jgi:hypothetical protein